MTTVDKSLLSQQPANIDSNFDLSNIDLSKSVRLGGGESGSVWMVTINDTEYALKVFDRVDKNFDMELLAMQFLEGNHAVKALATGEVVTQSGAKCKAILMPKLDKRLDQQPALSAAEISKLMSVVAATVNQLHTTGLIHNDISSQNIYLDKEGKPFLGDFGQASKANTYGITKDWQMFLETLYLMLGEKELASNPQATVYKPFQIHNRIVAVEDLSKDWQDSNMKDNILNIAHFMTHPEITYEDVTRLLGLLAGSGS